MFSFSVLVQKATLNILHHVYYPFLMLPCHPVGIVSKAQERLNFGGSNNNFKFPFLHCLGPGAFISLE